MSVVQDKDRQSVIVKERRQVRHALRQDTIVRTRPTIVVRTRYIEKPKARPAILPALAVHSAAFLAIAGLIFFLSSLTGQVMVEKARKDLSETSQRTSAAKKAETLIQERVNLLTRSDKVEEWAMAHGMVASDGLGQTATLMHDGANVH